MVKTSSSRMIRRKRNTGRPHRQEQSSVIRLIDAPRWNVPTGEVIGPGGRSGARAGSYKTLLQTVYGANVLVGNAVTPQFFAYPVALNSFANFASYAALFDSFRITVAEFRFSQAHPGLAAQYPRLAYFPDFDDGTPPASEAAVYSHPKVKYHVFTPTNTEFAVSIKPKVALATYQGGAFSGYSQPNGAVWLDCNNPGIQHFGLKGAIDNFTDSTIDIQVSIKIWVEFRDPL
jgi:hypothetical protein